MMPAHELLRRAIHDKDIRVKDVASLLGVSAALVYKWIESPEVLPDQSEPTGAANPLARTRDLFHSIGDIRLIQWLCEHANGTFCPNDPPAGSNGTPRPHVSRQALDLGAMFGMVLSAVPREGRPTVEQANALRAAWSAVKMAGEAMVRDAERQAKFK
jgi:hypothetical protein